ncbi:ArsR/SmtB family transcription factor [Gordonibacter sp.]|uniref:ArsR/SmtB family transcription factor n=1 Tax=Gordonibacter sp. TaxID=1968902 RepID=UPI002FC71B4D
MELQKKALLFKALSDENRLRIVEMVAAAEDICACKILDELDITQPTLSHHMKVLCNCGLVACRKEGKWMHYRLDQKTLNAIKGFIAGL